jgi:hypothetical protein
VGFTRWPSRSALSARRFTRLDVSPTGKPIRRRGRPSRRLSGKGALRSQNTYRNWGESAPDLDDSTPARPASLTGVLFGDLDNLGQADRVTFSFPHVAQLQLVVSGSSGQLSSVIFTSETGKFLCRKGIVIMRQGARWNLAAAGTVALAGRTVTTFKLHPMDDYLVVAEQEHGFMLVGFVLPIGDRSTRWFRFELSGA